MSQIILHYNIYCHIIVSEESTKTKTQDNKELDTRSSTAKMFSHNIYHPLLYMQVFKKIQLHPKAKLWMKSMNVMYTEISRCDKVGLR